MNNPWQIYDDLIEGISDEPTVKNYQSGFYWSSVISSEDNMGIAKTIAVVTRESIALGETLIGRKIKDVAQLVKSWNFVEAAIGLAAINSWYNHPDRTGKFCADHPEFSPNTTDAFSVYFNDIQGKKVTVVGHFPYIENKLSENCQLSVLEREPSMGDFPDSACEYILPEQDYVFVTACTFVNKTFTRLLSLSENAKFILVGPSTPSSKILFDHNVYGLSGLIVNDTAKMQNILRGASTMDIFDASDKVDLIALR